LRYDTPGIPSFWLEKTERIVANGRKMISARNAKS
jgi:hypothetical protein